MEYHFSNGAIQWQIPKIYKSSITHFWASIIVSEILPIEIFDLEKINQDHGVQLLECCHSMRDIKIYTLHFLHFLFSPRCDLYAREKYTHTHMQTQKWTNPWLSVKSYRFAKQWWSAYYRSNLIEKPAQNRQFPVKWIYSCCLHSLTFAQIVWSNFKKIVIIACIADLNFEK